ncbi:hypothetical protein [Pseudomonas plecoglossicida]|jgi:hypothetical protein|uniref:hypothetical protein n=1 Tax=Pseudomonas plecoglossicida TaxID=70775 RepID=UPI000698517F|nr:hypothetical protein [Pseudomonas plecoglossicida]
MNMLDTPAIRLEPWQRELVHIASLVSKDLDHDASVTDSPRTLWWGGGYSDLLPLCADGLSGELLIADNESRCLRKSTALVAKARAVRLMALSDLSRDAGVIETLLQGAVLRDIDGYLALEEKLRFGIERSPAVPSGWASRIVMDFALNRVGAESEQQLMSETFRALSLSGSVLCAVLVSDEPLNSLQSVRSAPAGAPLRIPSEQAVISAFERAGFHGITLHWSPTAAEAIDRIGDAEIRMCTVQAWKGKQGPCWELGQAVMYRGPWSEVRDDDNHVYRRGERVAVCAKTYDLMMRPPYQGSFLGLRSVNEPPLAEAALFDCNTPALRDPKVTKGLLPFEGAQASACCSSVSGCC